MPDFVDFLYSKICNINISRQSVWSWFRKDFVSRFISGPVPFCHPVFSFVGGEHETELAVFTARKRVCCMEPHSSFTRIITPLLLPASWPSDALWFATSSFGVFSRRHTLATEDAHLVGFHHYRTDWIRITALPALRVVGVDTFIPISISPETSTVSTNILLTLLRRLRGLSPWPEVEVLKLRAVLDSHHLYRVRFHLGIPKKVIDKQLPYKGAVRPQDK